jgi:hypothetical protein
MRIAPQPERPGAARHSSLITRHSVSVHIDELVLHGFARGDLHRIADAVERELARLMGEGGAPVSQTSRLALKRIDAGAFRVKAGSKAQTTGTQIAQAVYRSLRQQTRVSAGSTAVRPGGSSR